MYAQEQLVLLGNRLAGVVDKVTPSPKPSSEVNGVTDLRKSVSIPWSSLGSGWSIVFHTVGFLLLVAVIVLAIGLIVSGLHAQGAAMANKPKSAKRAFSNAFTHLKGAGLAFAAVPATIIAFGIWIWAF